MAREGRRGFVAFGNASTGAELDLLKESVRRFIPLRKPASPLAGGSHPTALLPDRGNSRLFVALTDRDEIAVLDTATGEPVSYLATKLRGQQCGGSDPEYLALSPDEKTLFSANAISDSVAVFDLAKLTSGQPLQATGFIPTEWYPPVVAATSKDLLIASAKGRGSGPNPKSIGKTADGLPTYPYGPALINGSVARIALADLPASLSTFTTQVSEANAARGHADRVRSPPGENN